MWSNCIHFYSTKRLPRNDSWVTSVVHTASRVTRYSATAYEESSQTLWGNTCVCPHKCLCNTSQLIHVCVVMKNHVCLWEVPCFNKSSQYICFLLKNAIEALREYKFCLWKDGLHNNTYCFEVGLTWFASYWFWCNKTSYNSSKTVTDKCTVQSLFLKNLDRAGQTCIGHRHNASALEEWGLG